MNLESRPELKRTLYCLAHAGGDLVIVCTPHEPVVLRSPSDVLKHLLTLLDGSRSVRQLREQLQQLGLTCTEAEVLDKLSRLDALLLLEDRTDESEESRVARDESNRYHRQMLFLAAAQSGGTAFSAEAQRRLSRTHLAVLGLGGFGSHIVYQAALMGFGKITAVDFDVAKSSDLNRQCLYAVSDVGRKKADAAADRCQQLNASVDYRFLDRRITGADDLTAVLEGVDLGILSADTPREKIFSWMNEAAYALGVPVLYALGILQTCFRVGPLVMPGQTACFDCSMAGRELVTGDPVAGFINGRNRGGVIVPTIMMATGLMMFEALKHLTGFAECALYNRRLLVDLNTYATRFEPFERRQECPYCTEQPGL